MFTILGQVKTLLTPHNVCVFATLRCEAVISYVLQDVQNPSYIRVITVSCMARRSVWKILQMQFGIQTRCSEENHCILSKNEFDIIWDKSSWFLDPSRIRQTWACKLHFLQDLRAEITRDHFRRFQSLFCKSSSRGRAHIALPSHNQSFLIVTLWALNVISVLVSSIQVHLFS